MDNFIAVDVETTGLSFTNDRIIQFGCAVFLRRKCVFRTGFYIAETEVPNNAYFVNKITDSQIENGKDPEWAYTLIASMIHKQPRTILAYNAPFDLTMLAMAFQRHKIAYDFGLLHIIDPLVIARKFYPPWYRNRLINACDRYRIPYDDTHDAADDSEAAGHIFCAQRNYHGLRGSLRNLGERQLRWHTEWAENYRAYSLARGRSVEITPWPYDKELSCFQANEQSTLWQSSLA